MVAVSVSSLERVEMRKRWRKKERERVMVAWGGCKEEGEGGLRMQILPTNPER